METLNKNTHRIILLTVHKQFVVKVPKDIPIESIQCDDIRNGIYYKNIDEDNEIIECDESACNVVEIENTEDGDFDMFYDCESEEEIDSDDEYAECEEDNCTEQATHIFKDLSMYVCKKHYDDLC